MCINYNFVFVNMQLYGFILMNIIVALFIDIKCAYTIYKKIIL